MKSARTAGGTPQPRPSLPIQPLGLPEGESHDLITCLLGSDGGDLFLTGAGAALPPDVATNAQEA